jgi:hypothetical protein
MSKTTSKKPTSPLELFVTMEDAIERFRKATLDPKLGLHDASHSMEMAKSNLRYCIKLLEQRLAAAEIDAKRYRKVRRLSLDSADVGVVKQGFSNGWGRASLTHLRVSKLDKYLDNQKTVVKRKSAGVTQKSCIAAEQAEEV